MGEFVKIRGLPSEWDCLFNMTIDRISLLVIHLLHDGKLRVPKHQSSVKLERNLSEIF